MLKWMRVLARESGDNEVQIRFHNDIILDFNSTQITLLTRDCSAPIRKWLPEEFYDLLMKGQII